MEKAFFTLTSFTLSGDIKPQMQYTVTDLVNALPATAR
jgi:hypothetical protein